MSHECCECVERLSGLNAGLTKDFNAMLVANSKAEAALQAAQEEIARLRDTLTKPTGTHQRLIAEMEVHHATASRPGCRECEDIDNLECPLMAALSSVEPASPLATESKTADQEWAEAAKHCRTEECPNVPTGYCWICTDRNLKAFHHAPSPDTRAAQEEGK